MRILIVCPYDWNRPGGVKTHIVDSAKSLLALGHDVVVLSPVQGTAVLPEGWEIVDQNASIPENAALFSMEAGRTVQFGGTQIDLTWMNGVSRERIKRSLKSFSPDVIHFHTPWSPFLSLQLLQLAAELRVNNEIQSRFIATFHDTPAESGLGKLLGAYIMPLVARYFMRGFDQVIAVSEPQSGYLTRFTNQKVHVIPNGVHAPKLSMDSQKASKWADFGPYLLFLGRLEYRKGLMDAIEVFRRVSQSNSEIKLVIAGDGPLRKQAEAKISSYNLDNVLFTGMVSDFEKWELMTHAKIYLAPALFGESFGIVLLEAMIVGTPVVGYANPGYKSVITGCFDEQFVEPGRIEKLESVVSELLKDEKKLLKLSQKGLDCSKKFSWDRIVEEYIQIYVK